MPEWDAHRGIVAQTEVPPLEGDLLEFSGFTSGYSQ